MDKTADNIIIVAPYTKRFGVAVFSRSELVHFSVQGYRTNASLPIEISKLIVDFVPGLIIVKELNARQVDAIPQQRIVDLTRRIAAAHEISLRVADFEAVKMSLTSHDVEQTHKNVFSVITQMFPELSKFAAFQNDSQEEYYTPVLAAVAIGVVHQSLHLARRRQT